MKITKWLAALTVISLLAWPALSVNTIKGCACSPGSCSSPPKMACCDRCSDESRYSQVHTCNCQISSFSGTEVSDRCYSYFSRSSSRQFSRDGHSTSSSRPNNGDIYPSSPRADFDGIGPPDLDVVEYLPPSAKLVFDVLTSCGPLTQKDLINETDLPPRTVRYALCRLKEESIIRECFYFPDARQSLYSLYSPHNLDGLNEADAEAGQV